MNLSNIDPPLDDLTYYYSGREDCHASKQWSSARDHYLFHFVTKGKGTARINAREVEILPGQGFLFAPNEISAYKADHTDPWSYVWIAFHGQKAARYLGHWGMVEGSHLYQSDDAGATSRELEEVLPGFSRCRNGFDQLSLLYKVFSILENHAVSQAGHPSGSTKPDRFMTRIYEYIHRNFARSSTSVEKMAAYMGVSRTHLCHLVRTHSGRTPKDLLLDYRMEQAKLMLAYKDISINGIGASIGYDDQLSFSRAFRNHEGQSPRQYRNYMRGLARG